MNLDVAKKVTAKIEKYAEEKRTKYCNCYL